MLKFAPLALIALTACQTGSEAGLRSHLDQVVGKPESAAIDLLGLPDRTYEIDGSKYVSFRKSVSGYDEGLPPNYSSTIVGNTVYTQTVGGVPGGTFTNHCTVDFRVSKGKIQDYRYRGNACRY